ncbi:MAG: glycosyltransferase family 2 protein [Candidatus Moranbacteria bacterium]|nr:glycosyltransferase family 2 protein [Candidatus Moranbacteria bacterium]
MIHDSVTEPLVTIAVNGYKNPELLRLCLSALYRELTRVPFTYEIIVTDSATEEDTESIMREEFPEARFFPFVANVGFKTLFNVSLIESRGKYIFLINSDILINQETVPMLMRYLESDRKTKLVGPKQINFNGTLQLSCFRYYQPETILYRRTWLGRLPFGRKHLDWFVMKNYDHATPKAVDWITGSAMFVEREAALRVGPMDNRFFMYMEDVDWCRRFWEHGYQVVYCPDATVYHYHAKGSARGGILGLFFNQLTWWHIMSAIRYFRKYFRKPIPHGE